jgi:hypothetical protein
MSKTASECCPTWNTYDACSRATAFPLRWRRASSVCKAPLKNPLPAPSRPTPASGGSSGAAASIPAKSLGALSTGSSFSRHVYNSRRLMPSSFVSATMLSHCFSLSTAICRKAFGNFPTRFFATYHRSLCQGCRFAVSQSRGSIQRLLLVLICFCHCHEVGADQPGLARFPILLPLAAGQVGERS